jgi:hypothetical protein
MTPLMNSTSQNNGWSLGFKGYACFFIFLKHPFDKRISKFWRTLKRVVEDFFVPKYSGAVLLLLVLLSVLLLYSRNTYLLKTSVPNF